MVWEAGILGLIIGFLIGLTGMGGGAMMTPILVWAGWALPAVAVGTNLVWTTITKIVGATVHYREKNVNLRLVWQLAKGSIPGALLGLSAFGFVKHAAGVDYLNNLIIHALGGTLIAVAVGIALRECVFRHSQSSKAALATEEGLRSWLVPLIGFVVGVLVAFTSVGSGSLVITSLLLLFPGERLKNLVGSDVFHGLLLVGVAAFAHWHFGDVDVRLVRSLLFGSIPGVWLGSLLAGRAPDRVLRPSVAMLLFISGVKLI
jgi:uncharacterized membrane protein YfcA